MELTEALYTTRAMRRVTDEPIPDEIVHQLVDAAIRAPSGGNRQDWCFLVLTDQRVTRSLGDLYAESWDYAMRTMYAGRRDAAEASGDDATLALQSSSRWLRDNFGNVPLVVVACHRNDLSGASIYPAVWNMMLAARGHEIGATLTTLMTWYRHDEACALLGIPMDKGWKMAAAVALGYPEGRWGVAPRPPASHVTFRDGWGNPVDWEFRGPWWSAD